MYDPSNFISQGCEQVITNDIVKVAVHPQDVANKWICRHLYEKSLCKRAHATCKS